LPTAAAITIRPLKFPNSLLLDFLRDYTAILDPQTTWICGCSFKFGSLPASIMTFITFIDSATEQVSLRIDPAGHLVVSRAGVTLATSVISLTAGIENYIEFKATINAATGSFEARVNNVSVIPATSGVNTRNTANSTADRVKFGCNVNMGACDADDFYICDGNGAAPNNNFLGDVRVDAGLPNGAGANTGLAPLSGINWQNVNENPSNDDTTYNSASVVGTKDTYAVADIVHNPTSIFGVQVNMTARKDDAGARSIAAVTRSGGADTDGATQALTTTYNQYREVVALDPATGLPWTKTGYNAAEFGAKVAA
jgi:hypothetical protein